MQSSQATPVRQKLVLGLVKEEEALKTMETRVESTDSNPGFGTS